MKLKRKNFFYFCTTILLLCLKQSFLGEPKRNLDEDEGQKSENYITIYFKENVNYTNGFSNEMRKDISSIKIGDYEKSATDELKIEVNTPIKIQFSTPVKTLESFFDVFFDDNGEYILEVWTCLILMLL